MTMPVFLTLLGVIYFAFVFCVWCLCAAAARADRLMGLEDRL